MFLVKGLMSIIGPIRRMTTVVEKPVLSKLRKKTGFPFISCKNALMKFNNDIVQAEVWLKEQAQKEGWAKATKLQSRPMSHGLVGLLHTENSATLIEVNCETDFVARNQKFAELVNNLTISCNNHFNSLTAKKIQIAKEEANTIVTPDGGTVGDLIAYQVGNIGENMALRRAVHMIASPTTFLSHSVHISGDEIKLSSDCRLGKYGTIVEIERLEDQDITSYLVVDPFNVTQQICQHIIGMNPKTVGQPGDTKASSKDEETKLLLQEFLTDSSVLVQEVLKDNCLKVVDFVRFECGEILPGEDL